MDLRSRVIELMAPYGVGDEIAPGLRLVHVSTDLGPRLTFELDGETVHVEVTPATMGAPFAVRTERLHLAYRSPSHAPIEPKRGLAICRSVAAIARENEEAVLRAVAEDARANESQSRIREVHVSAMLEPALDDGRRYYTVNPYVGCLIGCRFCYAQSRTSSRRRLEQLPEVPWGSYTEVRVNGAEVLARELEGAEPAPIKFCPIVSDAYQPVEARYGVTRACLEAIRAAGRGFTPLVLTRATLIERDIDLLAAIPGAGAGVSIPTVDDAVRDHFEPRASTIDERVETLRKLKAAGVRTLAVVQPMLPGPIDALADLLRDTVESVSLDVLRSLEGAERDFADPRYADARDERWQRDRLDELRRALEARHVPIWKSDLPP